ncbi:MAG: hypothetical protein ACK4E3_06640 [Brevundimonas sp.]|jgi:hypothetical protein|uniref:hypothetical protein n=1 Tax=Brevundimonas sp. TaxID=1871086 RepID=UPI00391A4D4B
MRKSLLLAGVTVAMMAAVPAMAQVAGGVTGRVTGGVTGGIETSRPDLGVRDTVRDTRDFGRDTLSGTRDAVRGTDARAGADADASARVSVERRRVSTQADVNAGTSVYARDGEMLGHVVGTTRNTRGYVQSVLVRTSDGVVRSVPAGSASIEGDAMVMGWTRARFERAPQERMESPPQSGGSSERERQGEISPYE